ncbi:uncharacterized protein LOC127004891 isoform X2 [Eriocheir sinensis]|uniref:uncharacterized protein LOC127004891 isoform X2 n=1 Tax=Eriocheir sinensis TaxID=95602 RepID=UPI0021C9EA79|nr:uncharacterized protein LOC127004891 isoform X2 [Eriocheir sinensis]
MYRSGAAERRPYDQTEDNDVFYDTVDNDNPDCVVVGVRRPHCDSQGGDPTPVLPPENDPAPPHEDDPALTSPHDNDPTPATPHGDPAPALLHKDDPAPALLHKDGPAPALTLAHDDPAPALPHKDGPAPTLAHDDPAPALPHKDGPAPTLAHDDPAPALPHTDGPAPTLAHDDPAPALPHKDGPAPTLAHDDPAPALPHKDGPAPTLAHDDPAPALTRKDGPAPTLAHDDPAPSLPHKYGPSLAQLLALPHEPAPDPGLSYKYGPSLAHEGAPAPGLTHKDGPSLAQLREGAPALAQQVEGYQMDTKPHRLEWSDLTPRAKPELISMEWECDVDDPFEQALAKRYRQTTAKAESQTSTSEDDEAQALLQSMKKLKTDGGQHDRKAQEKHYQDKEREQDKEHYTKILQDTLHDHEGKSGSIQHHTSEEESYVRTMQHEMDRKDKEERDEVTRTLQHYPDEERDEVRRTLEDYKKERDEVRRTLQNYGDKEKEVTRTLQNYKDEENNEVKRTLQHYGDEEKDEVKRTLQHYGDEEKDEVKRTLQHYGDEEKDEVKRTLQHYGYEEKDEVKRTLQHYGDEEKDEVKRTLQHYGDEEKDEVKRTLQHYGDEEKDEVKRTLQHYGDEEREEVKRTLQHYGDEEKDEVKRTLQHYGYEEREEVKRTLQDYQDEENDENERIWQQYHSEEKDEAERAQHPNKEKNPIGRLHQHHIDEDEDGTALHRNAEYNAAEKGNEDAAKQLLDAEENEGRDNSTLQNATDEEEQMDTDEDKKEEEMSQLRLTLEGQDSSMSTRDQDNQQPQVQDKAARSAQGGHRSRESSSDNRRPWRNQHSSGEDSNYGSPSRHQYSWSHRSIPQQSRSPWTQRQGQYYNSGHYYKNSDNSHYSGALNDGFPSNTEDASGALTPEDLAQVLVECSSFRSTFSNLFEYNFFGRESVQQVAAAHTQVFHLDRIGVQLQPQIKLCQAYPSPKGCIQGLTCQDLHLCNTYISGWCLEKPCSLGHSLFTNHNKAIFEKFCLGNLPPHRLKKLLHHLVSTAAPASSRLDVCQAYNRGGCDRADCQALHLCLSFVVGRGRCGRSNCLLNHNPNTSDCCRLLTAHGISVNETIMDIIVALLSANPALATATMPSTPARTPNTQADVTVPSTAARPPNIWGSDGGAVFKKPSTFFDKVKQKFGLNDNSSTNNTRQESHSQRSRGSAAHYQSDDSEDTTEAGAVGGQKPTKSSNGNVPKRHVGKHSSSDRSPPDRTGGIQRTVWAYHRQGNVRLSEICRFSLEKVCRKEDEGCPRLHSSRPFHWQVSDGKGQHSWLNIPGTIVSCLESAFCDPAKNGLRLPPLSQAQLRHLENVLDQDSWYANFEAMVLTNLDCSKVVAVRRLCVQDGAPAPYSKSRTLNWYFCDINGKWIKYGQADTTGQAGRASNLTSADIENHYLASPSKPLSFKVAQQRYHINFDAMTQINEATKVHRAVRRRPQLYVDASAQKTPTGTGATSSMHKKKQ